MVKISELTTYKYYIVVKCGIMYTDSSIRISEQSMNLINLASKQLEITSKKNVLEILVREGAKAKGIKEIEIVRPN